MVLTLRLCVMYGSQNKERLLPYTALTDWFHTTQVESLMFLPCIIRRSRNNQHYVLICTQYKGVMHRPPTTRSSVFSLSNFHCPYRCYHYSTYQQLVTRAQTTVLSWFKEQLYIPLFIYMNCQSNKDL
jgi:hypothetical protein